MSVRRFWFAIVPLLCLGGPAAGQQTPALASSQATAFMGTWPLTMTNPERARETVRVWDENSVASAPASDSATTVGLGGLGFGDGVEQGSR